MAKLTKVRVTSATVKANFKLDEAEAQALLNPAALEQDVTLMITPPIEESTLERHERHAQEFQDQIDAKVDAQMVNDQDRPAH